MPKLKTHTKYLKERLYSTKNKLQIFQTVSFDWTRGKDLTVTAEINETVNKRWGEGGGEECACSACGRW